MPEGTGIDDPQQDPPKADPKLELKFSQDDLDRVVGERLARAKPADYDEVKAKAAELDKLKEGQKSDLQKALDDAAKADSRANKAVASANSVLKRASILAEAATQNAADPEIVVALLVADESVTVDESGKVVGAKEAVKKLLKEKAFLAKAAASGASGGQFGGNDQPDLDAQMREAEKKGDWEAVMRIKLAKATGA